MRRGHPLRDAVLLLARVPLRPLYRELEETLGRIFEAHVLVAPTTTLAHQAAFDALMTEKDAIVLDHQVHQSVHQAANLARARGTRVELVRHEELGRARDVIANLARRHHTVWFGIDGVLSMYGDLAPFDLLESLLAIAPNVRLYIDDAHGMSWRGSTAAAASSPTCASTNSVLVATSMAKGFGVGGGILVFASARSAIACASAAVRSCSPGRSSRPCSAPRSPRPGST